MGNNPSESSKLDKVVGGNLQHHRTLAGFTQRSLGAACPKGLSSQQISKFEKGLNRISSVQLVEFARICGVTVQDLLAGVADELPSGKTYDRRDQIMMQKYQTLPEDMRESMRNFVGALARSVAESLGGTR